MIELPAAGLDLSLAFKRVRRELRDQPKTGRVFVANALELELAEANLEDWTGELAGRLELRQWAPGPIEFCDAPKGKDLVRPAARLSLTDRVVFTAAVGACLPAIDAATRWSQGACDFAPRLDPTKLDHHDWLRNPFKGWKEFRERSVQRTESQAFEWVVTADIAGYFENVGIDLLVSDLIRIGSPHEAVKVISDSLNAWAVPSGRGVPQGILASDVLAKLYLEVVDQELRNEGLVHLRYVDDIRVFAGTRPAAQRALLTVTRALRGRGLTLQSAKSKIISTDAAREDFEGPIPLIQNLAQSDFAVARAAGLMQSDVSVPMVDIDALLALNPDEIDDTVLHRAYAEYVTGHEPFHPTMFKFLIGKFGRRQDDYAVAHAGQALISRPELTYAVLMYFERLGRPWRFEKIVARALRADVGAIYPYQRYQLLDWLQRNIESPDSGTLQIVRTMAFNSRSPRFLQASARLLLGRAGEQADLERLVKLFQASTDELERAQALCALERLEKGRRNSLAGRASREGSWVRWAAERIRAAA